MHSVIIVDDEIYFRKGLIRMIDWEGNGYQVIGEADNGEDALAMIRDKKPDLVITDIRMPVLDGLDLIQAAEKEKLDTEFVIISGHNDFHYAQQAVRFGVLDYVLKPVDEDDIVDALGKLRDKLTKKRQLQERRRMLLSEKQIEALIRGESEGAATEDWMEHEMASGPQTFTYAMIELNNVHPWSDRKQPSKEELRAAIREAVRQLVPSASDPILYEHRRTYGLIVPGLYLTEAGGNVRAFMELLLLRLDERYELEFRAYTGTTVQQLNHIKESYISAKEALSYKYYRSPDRVIAISDVSGTELVYGQLDDDVCRRLVEAVEENDSNEMKQVIDSLFSEFRDKRFSPEAIKTGIVQCVLVICKSIRGMEGDETELSSFEPVINWHDHNVTLEEIRRLLTAFVFEAGDLVGTLYRTYGKGRIHKVKTYVDQNYSKNISLKTIASQFYMNPAYLGQLFKRNYGLYFNDYLQKLRIAEAKKLLRIKDLRIYEVAERVGFNNPDYFVTQFDKLERMTPSEYRNKLNLQ
ncbi:response regulator transcription factor [Paenibacillus harenae]|uniref:Two-component system response regulator YesN n=1 Tax=Paenibacillus harenae TaxID=306543 RepID=A0ABT9U901_PAEHA|nr:response regulator transcription factor [Paenibacillus harenae]MDQ0115481.1 two-component system response regulator YesN [Paenibacillus harenae]